MHATKDIAVGAMKEEAGKVFNKPETELKGKIQNEQGHAEYDAAKAKVEAEGIGDQLKGNLKEGWGNLTGNERLAAEGKAQHQKGEVKRATNFWAPLVSS